MARTKWKKLVPELEHKALKKLFLRIKNVDSLKDVSAFLDLLFTPEEKRLILRRIAILDLLKEGKSYSKIRSFLEVARSTISNVRDIGENRGYGRNPSRKRVYSVFKTRRKEKKLFRPYKGAESII